jgi:ATP-dependent DNA ligase
LFHAACIFAPSDLLELPGRDLRLEHFAKRRRLLARLVRKPRSGLLLNAVFEQEGPLVFEHACLLGCEGIVSKRKHSRYRSGRSRDWLNVKNPNAPVVKREAGRPREKGIDFDRGLAFQGASGGMLGGNAGHNYKQRGAKPR